MSCLDVMYQVYGPHQPYFAAAYTPYHQVRAFSRLGPRRRVARPGFSEHCVFPEVQGASAPSPESDQRRAPPGCRACPRCHPVDWANHFSLLSRKATKPC